MVKFIGIFKQPEYLALLISIVAVCINVYIAHKNRKQLLAKEEYFKLQQIVEKIIAKLLIIDNKQEKLKNYIELSYKASQSSNSKFIDSNDTFNKESFEKNGEEVTALIDIYFGDIGPEWNSCLDGMSALYTHVFILHNDINNKNQIDWKSAIDDFNKKSEVLGNKPKCIADKLKQKLYEYKKENL